MADHEAHHENPTEKWSVIQPKRRVRDDTIYISSSEATALQHRLNIIGLAPVLLSEMSRSLQRSGWKFENVYRGNSGVSPPINTSTTQYRMLPITNRWNDRAIFVRNV